MSNSFSVALFGSTARNTTDEHSDCDLLIVTENTKEFDYKVLETYTTKNDYSISYYNYDKLIFLSNQGNLFIQHLKNEAIIIKDDKDKLKKIFSSYSPKKSYKKDIQRTIRYLKVFSHYPGNIEGENWLCDCLYVGIRNYLIFENAENKIYKFSFPDLVNDLILRKRITSNEEKLLLKLRVIKQSYRNRSLTPNLTNYISSLLRVFCKIGIFLNITSMSVDDFERLVIYQIRNKKLYSMYEKLRLFEGLYRGKNKRIEIIENIISNPQFYTPKFKNKRYVENLLKYL